MAEGATRDRALHSKVSIPGPLRLGVAIKHSDSVANVNCSAVPPYRGNRPAYAPPGLLSQPTVSAQTVCLKSQIHAMYMYTPVDQPHFKQIRGLVDVPRC